MYESHSFRERKEGEGGRRKRGKKGGRKERGRKKALETELSLAATKTGWKGTEEKLVTAHNGFRALCYSDGDGPASEVVIAQHGLCHMCSVYTALNSSYEV